MATKSVRRAAAFIALTVLAAAAVSASAAPLQPLGFAGRWAMISSKSHFAEGVTGPAPAAADLDVTKDDGTALAWTLVERDGAVVDASEFGDTLIDGSPSKIVVDGVFAPVIVKRVGPHALDLTSTLGGGAKQIIHMHLEQDGPLAIDETLTSPSGKSATQHLEFLRAKD